jgi:hypothetical protein
VDANIYLCDGRLIYQKDEDSQADIVVPALGKSEDGEPLESEAMQLISGTGPLQGTPANQAPNEGAKGSRQGLTQACLKGTALCAIVVAVVTVLAFGFDPSTHLPGASKATAGQQPPTSSREASHDHQEQQKARVKSGNKALPGSFKIEKTTDGKS